MSETFCPNIQPRAHARLTGLTIPNLNLKFQAVFVMGPRSAIKQPNPGSGRWLQVEVEIVWIHKSPNVLTRCLVAYARCVRSRCGAREGLWLEQGSQSFDALLSFAWPHVQSCYNNYMYSASVINQDCAIAHIS